MPYYRVTVHYYDGSSVTAIRAHLSTDVDYVLRYFKEQLRTKISKPVDDLEVVMAPKTAPDVKKFIARHSRM